MADTERISQPSLGSNELGTETNDTHRTRASAGTDTQLHKAAKSKAKNKDNDDNTNDDEKVLKNGDDDEFSESNETDE